MSLDIHEGIPCVAILPIGNVLSIPAGHLPGGNYVDNRGMDEHRIRRRHVRAIIFNDFNDSFTEFASRIGVAESTVSRWFMEGPGRKNIGEKNARRIENALGLERHSLDHDSDKLATEFIAISWLEDFLQLEPEQKAQINEIVEDRIIRFRATNGPKRRKKSLEARAR